MIYEISFNAMTTSGERVGTRKFTIETVHPLNVDKKSMCFGRMCVEYARLTGLKCSYVHINEIRKDDETLC